jgi:hypothetical protein
VLHSALLAEKGRCSMSICTGPRRRARRGHLVRAGLVGLAVLASTAFGLSPASAAPTSTISLAPSDVQLILYPVENSGPLTVDRITAGGGIGGGGVTSTYTPTPVTTEWGGGVVVQLPAGLDGSAMDVSLDLMATESSPPTRTYSTASAAPNQLVVTDLGGGSYRVDLPADDFVNGPFGALTFDNVTSADHRIDVVGAEPYFLQFSGTGVSVQNVAPQIMALADLPCPVVSHGMTCPSTLVDAGGTFAITVPAGSLLRSLGLGTLDGMALALDQFDEYGDPVGEPLVLTDRPGLVRVTDPYNATVHLPATTRGGTYGLTLVQATGTAGAISISFGELRVKGIPATPRIVNAGLLSDTGWDETPSAAAAGKGSVPMVSAGVWMMLLAGGIAAGTLRGRRRASAVAD